MDAALLLSHCPRPVGFLVAQKSMKGIIGFFARIFQSIPVSRPQDTAKTGPGTISMEVGSAEVIGNGTTFTELNPGKHMICPKGEDPIRIKEIVSDTLLILGEPAKNSMERRVYKIFDKMDQSQVYSEVWKRLSQGGCIGIFPEGGSHDRTELLPLKAGVTLMALGAMAKYNIPVYIVPCGLNYFHGHRFRGSVLVEFGRAHRIPDRLAKLYLEDQRRACSELLQTVKQLMETVIIHAPDRESYELLGLVRKIYQPIDLQISAEQYIELHNRFLVGFKNFKDRPEVRSVWDELTTYKSELENLGLDDHHIAESSKISGLKAFYLITIRFIVCVTTLLLAFPGIVLNFPIGITTRYLAEKHRKEALAASEVKIAGLDVVASKKVTLAMVIIPPVYIIYASLIGYYYGKEYGVASFFGLFALAGASIRFAEEGIKTARSLRAILKVRWIGSKIRDLSKTRKKLQTDIRDLVARLGPEIYQGDPENWRIIKEEHFNQEEESESTPLNVTGRFKPYKTVNPWESSIISDKEWEEIQEILG